MVSSLRALVRYHNASGTRVALRANAMVGAATVFVLGFAPDRWATVRGMVLAMVSVARTWQIRIAFAALCLMLATAAERRLTLGLDGWSRSLPVSARTAKRAAALAIAQSESFAVVLTILASLLSVMWCHVPISWAKVSGLVLIVAASAVALLQRQAWGRLVALAALGAAARGTVVFDVASLALLVLSDFVWRKPDQPRPQVATRSSTRPRMRFASWVVTTYGGVPIGGVINAALLPTIFVAFAYFILGHNADLPTDLADRTVRSFGALAVMASVAAMSNLVLRSTPAWGWARSLPRSSLERALTDAIVLAIPMSAIPIALLPLSPAQAVVIGAMIPPVACAGSSAIRVGRSRHTGAAGESTTIALVAGACVAIWPVSVVALIALTPLILRQAAARDRRLRPAEWVELQYHAAGDPGVLRRS